MPLDKDKAIIAQNSATAAAAIVAAEISAGRAVDPAARFDEVRTHIFNGTIALGGAEMVVETFTTPPAGVPTTAAPAAAPAPASSPSVLGGGQDPGTLELKFGKYRGQTVAQVFNSDVEWLKWVAREGNNEFMKGKVREYLTAQGVTDFARA